MKAFLPFAVAAALFALPGLTRAADPVKSVLVLSPEIDCPSCEDGIKRTLVTARGVTAADVDVLNNRVTVRFDPARITLKALVGRIAVMGYTATEKK